MIHNFNDFHNKRNSNVRLFDYRLNEKNKSTNKMGEVHQLTQKQIFSTPKDVIKESIKDLEIKLRQDMSLSIDDVKNKLSLIRAVSKLSNIFKDNPSVNKVKFNLFFNDDANYIPNFSDLEIETLKGVTLVYSEKTFNDTENKIYSYVEDTLSEVIVNDLEHYYGDLLSGVSRYKFYDYEMVINVDGTIYIDDSEVDLLNLDKNEKDFDDDEE